MLYFDYPASAPLRDVAKLAMLAALEAGGNPASPHAVGEAAGRRLEAARRQVAALVGRPAREVIFTAGGTEADNLALLGCVVAPDRRHMVVSAVEHRAVLEPALSLAARGWRVTVVPVDARGLVTPEALAAVLAPDTALVSIMAVNNEVGAVQPLADLAPLVRSAGAVFHVDAVQAAGMIDLAAVPADMLSLSAHKLGGPLGVGALVAAKGLVQPILFGGAHERGLRPGTPNVPALAGFGAAAAAVMAERAELAPRLAAWRDHLAATVLAAIPGARRLGDPATSAPHILGLAFPGLEGDALVTQLDMAGLAAATGAACTTLAPRPSHVLEAMGLDAATIAGSLRLGMGWATTSDEVDEAAATIIRVVQLLRDQRPMAL